MRYWRAIPPRARASRSCCAIRGFMRCSFTARRIGCGERGWLLAGRFVSHLGRMLTGIEIHPGAPHRQAAVHRSRHGRGHRRDDRDRRRLHALPRRDPGRPRTAARRVRPEAPSDSRQRRDRRLRRAGAGAVPRRRRRAHRRRRRRAREVPDGATMVGVPARPVGEPPHEKPAAPTFDALRHSSRRHARSGRARPRAACSTRSRA